MTEEEIKKEKELRREDSRRERQEEWDKIRSLGWKARIQYFWDYYKFVLILIVALIFVISLVRTMITGALTDVLLNVAVLNPDTLSSDTVLMEEDFGNYLGGLGKREEIHFDSSIYIKENPLSQADTMGETKLTVFSAAGSMDAGLVPEEVFNYLQPKGVFKNLDDLLDDERKSAWAGELCYAEEPPELTEDGAAADTEGPAETETGDFAAAAAKESTGDSTDTAAKESTGDSTDTAAKESTGDSTDTAAKESIGDSADAAAKEDTGKSEEETAEAGAGDHEGKSIYGVRVDENGRMDDYIIYGDEPVYLCVFSTAKNVDTALKFLDFMKGMEKSEAE